MSACFLCSREHAVLPVVVNLVFVAAEGLMLHTQITLVFGTEETGPPCPPPRARTLPPSQHHRSLLHDSEPPSHPSLQIMCPQVDALIIGGGIMGTTVALMLKLLQPKWKVKLVEQHDRVAQEASNEWHNAGTGHAALCEPNYTPMNAQGEVEIDKAVATNQKVG